MTSQSNQWPEPNRADTGAMAATEVGMSREQARAGGSGAGERDRRRGDAGDGPERVVVVGGGYAGLFAARRASGRSRRGRVEVTVVDPASQWVERTRLHQVAAGDASVKRWPLARLFRGTGVSVVGGRVTEIDLMGGAVTVETGTGTTTRLPFDRLVYTLGSTADTGLVPGARDHAFVLDSTSTAEDLRNALRAGVASSGSTGARVAVVGGGLTGVEAATEIAEAYPELSVTLVTAGEIAGGLSVRGREYLLRAMGRFKVELRERKEVEEVERGAVRTAGGETIPADVVVWAAGFAVPDLARRSGLATDEQGRVLVDASLRSVSHPEVFAAGDSAWPVKPVGVGAVRPSAYTSTIMGAQAGTNVARELAGKSVKPLRFGYLMQSVSLGRRDGLVQFTDGNDKPLPMVATGRVAARIKEFVERLVVVGSLRLERLLPGAYAWRPAPKRKVCAKGAGEHGTAAALLSPRGHDAHTRTPQAGLPAPSGAPETSERETHSMTSHCKTYPDQDSARRAVAALRAAGVRSRDIRLLTGSPPHDTRHEPVGSYAGSVGPDAPVGTYGDRVLRRDRGTGGFAGDPDRQRQGSYGDADRVVIATYTDRAERSRVTGRRGARRLLRRAAFDENAVSRALDELASGHAIVLIDVAEITGDTEAQLEQMARAA